MALSNIRTQIKTVLEGVSGIGSVYEYERWFVDWGKLIELFKTTDNKINGWMISRTKTDEKTATIAGYNDRTHHIKVKGVYGLRDSDESELTFQALVESICEGLRGNHTLNGTCQDGGIVQVDMVETRLFAGVLCHYCELTFTASERISRT